MHAMEISMSGLDVEWRRLETIAYNLANSQTVVTADGSPFRAKQLVSGPSAGFSDYMAGGRAERGVMVYSVEEAQTPLRPVFEPGNPLADENGFVHYPDIDHAGQMVQMIQASRSYEANLAALKSAHQMYSKALEIGNRS